jgi:tRNA G18 (ribose-2'-O)-methylase SpoU
MQLVADLGDPRLDDYRNLRDGELRVRREAFICESAAVLKVLCERGRHPIRSVLLAEKRVAAVAPLLARLDPAVPVYVAEQPVLDGVVGFHFHRGVVAAAERVPVPRPEALLAELPPDPGCILLVEGLTNHDNVGGLFRNAAAFGADAILLDAATCDPLYRKAVRVSVGGALVVPYARGDRAVDLVAAARAAGFVVVALSPGATAVDLGAVRIPPRVAFLLGSEGPGLGPEALAAADLVARIPITTKVDSLNVATASGIALHLCRASRARPW